MTLSNKAYDVLKRFTTIVLPGIGTLYFAIAQIWNLPYAEQVVGTVTAIVTFLGGVLQISANNYSGDGVLKIDTKSIANRDIYRLDITTPLAEVEKKDSIMLKVKTDEKLQSFEP